MHQVLKCVLLGSITNTATPLCADYTLCYERNFIRAKVLILARNLRTSEEESQACCPTEQKNEVSSLAILKIIRTKHQNRAWLSLILYCMQTSSTLTTPSFSFSKLFNDHILFQDYTPFKFVCLHWTVKFHFPLHVSYKFAWSLGKIRTN